MKATITKTIYVEAAVRIYNETRGQYAYTGHSYRIDLFASGEVKPDIGWVIDYGDIKTFFEPVRLQLDHRCLSDIPALAQDASPSAIEQWIKQQLLPWPQWFAGVRVSLPEPHGFSLARLPEDPIMALPERVAFSFSAAQSLPQLPPGHPCRQLHGHTYQVELAAPDLDALAEPARRLFSALDGVYINELPGLEQATAERIAAWIWDQLALLNIAPAVVAVQETPHNRCHYFGD